MTFRSALLNARAVVTRIEADLDHAVPPDGTEFDAMADQDSVALGMINPTVGGDAGVWRAVRMRASPAARPAFARNPKW